VRVRCIDGTVVDDYLLTRRGQARIEYAPDDVDLWQLVANTSRNCNR
jgi:hypothetical protein